MAIENPKTCILPGIDQILVESIKAGSRKIHSETHKPTNSIRSKEEIPRPWKKSIISLFIRMKTKQIAVTIDSHCSYQLHIKINQHPSVKVNIVCRGKCWGSSVWVLS